MPPEEDAYQQLLARERAPFDLAAKHLRSVTEHVAKCANVSPDDVRVSFESVSDAWGWNVAISYWYRPKRAVYRYQQTYWDASLTVAIERALEHVRRDATRCTREGVYFALPQEGA
jgi:hypothetical protein